MVALSFLVAFVGLMVLGFLATGVLLPRASERAKNIVSVVALVTIAAPGILVILGALV